MRCCDRKLDGVAVCAMVPIHMPPPFSRSAAYAKRLADIAQYKALLAHKLEEEERRSEKELRRKADIERAYALIEARANMGCVRIFSNDSSAPWVRTLLFDDNEIKSYLMSNGFSYTDNTIEWCHPRPPPPLA